LQWLALTASSKKTIIESVPPMPGRTVGVLVLRVENTFRLTNPPTCPVWRAVVVPLGNRKVNPKRQSAGHTGCFVLVPVPIHFHPATEGPYALNCLNYINVKANQLPVITRMPAHPAATWSTHHRPEWLIQGYNAHCSSSLSPCTSQTLSRVDVHDDASVNAIVPSLSRQFDLRTAPT
jgi:hypothetical protein